MDNDTPRQQGEDRMLGYSRAQAAQGYSERGRARRRKHALVTALVVVLVAVLALGGAALAYVANIQGRLNSGVSDQLRGALSSVEDGQPFYMLLMGTDRSEQRAESAEYGQDESNYRTDSIILARIDPAGKQVSLVSIHRDTLVDLGENGQQKINAAYSIGGAPYTVETISKFAGVPISHYAEINFDNFSKVVDQLGGIEVNVPIDMDDDLANAHLKKGWQTLNGEQALALCRSRHSYDNYGDGDVFRASNQRMVISAIVQKVLASDPATMTATISTLADSVTTDFSLAQILTLASEFRGFDTSTNLHSAMEPTDSKYMNDGWYELCDTDAWKTMMQRVDQGLPPYESEDDDPTKGLAGQSTQGDGSSQGAQTDDATTTTAAETEAETDHSGSVLVLNGAGVQGLAGRISSTLAEDGFEATAETADSMDYQTTQVLYVGDENQAKAQGVAETLGLDTVAADDGTHAGMADVVVVLGADMADQ